MVPKGHLKWWDLYSESDQKDVEKLSEEIT